MKITKIALFHNGGTAVLPYIEIEHDGKTVQVDGNFSKTPNNHYAKPENGYTVYRTDIDDTRPIEVPDGGDIESAIATKLAI